MPRRKSTEPHKQEKRKKPDKPKWWNQTYLIFLVLRKENRAMSRSELIPKVLELDKQLSKQRGLPTLYHGKTPQNTVSGRLTTNNDKYFIRFIPPHSKKQFFKLAFKPGDFQSALENYQEWNRQLIELDWPWFFGDRKADSHPVIIPKTDEQSHESWVVQEHEPNVNGMSETLDGFMDSTFADKLLNAHTMGEIGEESGLYDEYGGLIEEVPSVVDILPLPPSFTIEHVQEPVLESFPVVQEPVLESISEVGPSDAADPVEQSHTDLGTNEPESHTAEHSELLGTSKVQIPELLTTDPVQDPGPAQDPEPLNNITKETKEYIIPKSLDEVLEIKPSLIPNAGNGVFAKRNIPKHTFLGFYFGVPYTEDEFDSLKEGVGVASQYAHRYKNTVLDATDEQGNLYDIHCPFHFINESKKPNIAFIEGNVVNQVICMSTRVIKTGEELYVDYGPEFPRPWEHPDGVDADVKEDVALDVKEEHNDFTDAKEDAADVQEAKQDIPKDFKEREDSSVESNVSCNESKGKSTCLTQ